MTGGATLGEQNVIDPILDALEPIQQRLSATEANVVESAARLRRIEGKLDQFIAALVESSRELTTLRVRLSEHANRSGEDMLRHQIALLDHESRLYRLEACNPAVPTGGLHSEHQGPPSARERALLTPRAANEKS